MALIVEDGSGIAGATSTVSLADAAAFVAARGLSVTLTEPLLVRAMDALLGVTLAGRKTYRASGLPVPRTGLIDAEGVPIPPDEVPPGYIAAQIWLAVAIAEGADPAALPTPAVVREKVGPIDTTFAVATGESTALSPLSIPRVRDALRPLVRGRGFGVGRISRA